MQNFLSSSTYFTWNYWISTWYTWVLHWLPIFLHWSLAWSLLNCNSVNVCKTPERSQIMGFVLAVDRHIPFKSLTFTCFFINLFSGWLTLTRSPLYPMQLLIPVAGIVPATRLRFKSSPQQVNFIALMMGYNNRNASRGIKVWSNTSAIRKNGTNTNCQNLRNNPIIIQFIFVISHFVDIDFGCNVKSIKTKLNDFTNTFFHIL